MDLNGFASAEPFFIYCVLTQKLFIRTKMNAKEELRKYVNKLFEFNL